MALTVSATDTELQKPVNVIFQQAFLRQARQLAPYFAGTKPGVLQENGGSATVKWRRIGALTPTTTALSEITGNAAYGQGRTPEAASTTDVTATVAKYGQFYILNEEVNVFLPNQHMAELTESLAISAGRSMNMLQRNVVEDNATLVYANSVASDGVVDKAIALDDIKRTVNTLVKNSTMPFSTMTTGSQNIGTLPILSAYWGLTHPDVAVDIAGLSGFTSVEKYAGQIDVAPGEFGTLGVAGKAVRFIQSEDASVDADSGAAVGSTGLRAGSSAVDLYTTVIYGREAVGSVGLGSPHTDGVYRAGDDLGAIKMISKPLGSGGAADPFDELQTIAWKGWHAGAILDANWVRGIRSGATDI